MPALPNITLLALLALPALAPAAEPRRAPEQVLEEVTVVGRPDPFREFLRATARYAVRFNALNDDEQFEMTCSDPREYQLGDGLFCSSRYSTTLADASPEGRAERTRLNAEAKALGQRLRAADPELQRLQVEWDRAVDRLNAYLQTPAGGRLFPNR